MPSENAIGFLRALTQRPPVATVAIAGPQAFLREYVLDALRVRLDHDGFKHRSLQIGGGDAIESLMNELEGADLFAPKRLVVCRILRSYRDRGADADESPDNRPGTSGEAVLAAAAERLSPAIRLVIICERETLPAKIRRVVEQKGLLVNCARPFDNQLGQYVELFARGAGVRLAPAAIDLLVARHGGDLSAIANAIHCAAITAEGQLLEAAAFSEASAVRSPELFELADAIARGQTNEVIALFERALNVGRDPIELLAVETIPVLRRMLLAADLLGQRRGAGNVASALGLAPNSTMATRAVEGARRLGLAPLRTAYKRATELDRSFKAGLIKERAPAIAAMLIDLLAGAQRAV